MADLEKQNDDFALLLNSCRQFDRAASVPRDEVDRIANIFKQLQLPLPQNAQQAMNGLDGMLLFLNDYGLVIRIEVNDAESSGDRAYHSAHVLKPIATFKLDKTVVEICPGCIPATGGHTEVGRRLRDSIETEGYVFWDIGNRNIGYVPLYSKEFPDGISVVIDRLAVRHGTGLKNLNLRMKSCMGAFNLQDFVYRPLTQKLMQAWPDQKNPADAALIKEFWQMCRDYAAEGKLVAGWNAFADSKHGIHSHATEAQYYGHAVSKIASAYQELINNPNAPAKPGIEKTFPRDFNFNHR